eukprot:TRINITY_DN6336_c0_g1_i5.p1 TRINITY_DN6336_c0_g1~~TRINITY_DN6336_c0_g1_i5.p1  ORF type:complete len:716 (+),score=86.87 TRINITY_DN6336_c0_g1_i5:119-2266(+)
MLLLENHILPVYDVIITKTDIQEEIEVMAISLDEPCLEIVQSVSEVLFKVYSVYFPWEFNSSETQLTIRNRSHSAMLSLLKEFEVCPDLVTKTAAASLLHFMMTTPLNELKGGYISADIEDIGIVFTVNRFFTYLVRLALYIQRSSADEEGQYIFKLTPLENAEALYRILMRMQVSSGFKQIEKKTNVTHNGKTSLLPPKELVTKIFGQDYVSLLRMPLAQQQITLRSMSPTQNSRQDAFEGRASSQMKGMRKSYMDSILVTPENNSTSKRELKKINSLTRLSQSGETQSPKGIMKYIQSRALSDNLRMDSESVQVFDAHAGNLFKIFLSYCAFGEPTNTNKLKSIKFMRLLRDAQLLEHGVLPRSKYTFKIQRLDSSKQLRTSMENREENDISRGGEQMRSLDRIEVDMIFSKLTGNMLHHELELRGSLPPSNIKSPNLSPSRIIRSSEGKFQNGKLEFETFLKAIEMIAEKLYPEYPVGQSVELIVTKNLLNLLENSEVVSSQEKQLNFDENLKRLVVILEDEDVVSVLSTAFRTLKIYYDYYADKNGTLDANEFMRLCKDFEIFPGIVSISKLMKVFKSLSILYTSPANQEQTNTSKSEFHGGSSKSKMQKSAPKIALIDENLFVESLALCSLEIKIFDDENATMRDKIIYLLERMNKSDGRKKVQRELGHTRHPNGGHWEITSGLPIRLKSSDSRKKLAKFPPNFDDVVGT